MSVHKKFSSDIMSWTVQGRPAVWVRPVCFSLLGDASRVPSFSCPQGPPQHPPSLCCGREAAVEHSVGRLSRTSQISGFDQLESIFQAHGFWFWMTGFRKVWKHWRELGTGTHPGHEMPVRMCHWVVWLLGKPFFSEVRLSWWLLRLATCAFLISSNP